MSRDSGQASVELIALLPLLGLLALGTWQIALAGHAAWAGAAAARAASRVAAVGGDPARTVRRIAGPRARLRQTADGGVRVTVPIPSAAGGRDLATLSTTARFEPQR